MTTDQTRLVKAGALAIAALLFIIGRVAGLSAEVLEEYTREKPMRIKIPVTYDGVSPLRAGKATP